MKIENLSQELKEKVKKLLESAPADQKADAIMQSIEMIEEAAHTILVTSYKNGGEWSMFNTRLIFVPVD